MRRDYDPRESVAIRNLLANARPYEIDDRERGRLIMRKSRLEDVPLSARRAFDDLNAEGYFHAQPCYCNRCLERPRWREQ